jgi:glutathione S-transferase
MLKLYGNKQSRAARCLWALEELGLPYIQIPLDMAAGQNKLPAYLAINPAGKVPTLVDGEFVLPESLAINGYLVAKAGSAQLWPDNIQFQARIIQWSSWAATEMEIPLTNIIREKRRTAAAGGAADSGFIAAQIEAAGVAMGLLDRNLGFRTHVAGDAFTLADINAYTAAMLGPMFLDMKAFPKVTEWLTRCAARAAWQRVQVIDESKLEPFA